MMKKRLMAAVLALAMMLCAGSAMACEDFASVTEGQELTKGAYRLEESDLSITVPTDVTATLCLNGQQARVYVKEGATLTLKDCVGTGRVVFMENYGGTVALQNVCVEDMSNDNVGKVTMTGGSIGRVENRINSELVVEGGSVGDVDNNMGSLFTLKDGSVASVTNIMQSTFMMEDGSVTSVTNNQDGTFTMEDGIVTENGSVTVNSGGVFELSGGAVSSKVSVNAGGTFRMTGGSVTADRTIRTAVTVRGEFTLSGGSVMSIGESSYGVYCDQGGRFMMEGGGVHVRGDNVAGVCVRERGSFTMTGGEVTATGNKSGSAFGVVHIGGIMIHAGRIEGGNLPERCAVLRLESEKNHPSIQYALPPAKDEAASIAPGSCVLSGGFGERFVVVGPPPVSGLPQTGDPGMLGAWVCLLAASGAMGMKMRRKK